MLNGLSAAASAPVGWAVANSAVASPAARLGRMKCTDLLLMVVLERLLLLGVALLELLLLHHRGACVVFFLSDPLLLEVLHFRVVLLVCIAATCWACCSSVLICS